VRKIIERLMIFIDNSNIFNGFQKYRIKADYEKLKNIITGNRVLEGIFLYEGVVYPISPYKVKWYEDLKKNSNYVIRTSFDKRINNFETFEKKIDVKIAIDMVSFAYENSYDTAALVSGDGDFLPLVKKIKDLGKKVEIWAFNYSLANALKEEINDNNLFYLDEILEELKIL
jgi:uncharacterized LabA/DUF88 family protein